MRKGLSDDFQGIDDSCKITVIGRELNSLNIDVAAVYETRIPDSGFLKKEHYTFFWQCSGVDECRKHGVGFTVSNTLLRMIKPIAGDIERIRLYIRRPSKPCAHICSM